MTVFVSDVFLAKYFLPRTLQLSFASSTHRQETSYCSNCHTRAAS